MFDVARHAGDGAASPRLPPARRWRRPCRSRSQGRGGFSEWLVGRVFELRPGRKQLPGSRRRRFRWPSRWRPFMPLGRIGHHQLGAQCLQHLRRSEAHRGGHGQQRGAGGGDIPVLPEVSSTMVMPGLGLPLLGVPDHVRANAAFDRVPGVAPFDLWPGWSRRAGRCG